MQSVPDILFDRVAACCTGACYHCTFFIYVFVDGVCGCRTDSSGYCNVDAADRTKIIRVEYEHRMGIVRRSIDACHGTGGRIVFGAQ